MLEHKISRKVLKIVAQECSNDDLTGPRLFLLTDDFICENALIFELIELAEDFSAKAFSHEYLRNRGQCHSLTFIQCRSYFETFQPSALFK